MRGYVTLSIDSTAFDDDSIGTLVADKLWTEDNIEELSDSIVTNCLEEGRKESLLKLANKIIEILKDK